MEGNPRVKIAANIKWEFITVLRSQWASYQIKLCHLHFNVYVWSKVNEPDNKSKIFSSDQYKYPVVVVV